MEKKMKEKKRVLVVSASAGAGHTISALAVKEAFESMYPEEIEITHVDILDYVTKLMKKVYRDVYLYLANSRPLVYGMIYKYTDKETFGSGFTDWAHTKKFRKYLRKQNYDFIISTHFLASNVVARMKEKKKKLSAPLLTILTDFGAHKIWVSKSEYYVVPDDINVEYFKQRGLSGENVYDFGIPVRRVFLENKPREMLRKKIGLSDDKKTILLLSGGFGVGPILDTIRSLEKLKTPHETIVVCGRNKELYDDCVKLKEKLNFNLIPVGFTTDIDEYMKASDVIITKPGGLTIAEALACHLPIVIVNPIIGQEDKNADRLLEEGCAIKISYLSIIYYYLDRLLNDEVRLNQIKTNIQRMAKPNAVNDLVQFVHRELNRK